MQVAFFDRDGTIIEDYPDEVWPSVSEPKFIDGAIETLAHVEKNGYKIIIITNQYLINEGFITFAQYESITQQMLAVIRQHNVEVLDIFFCPHRRDEGCACCKPRRGMVQQAVQKYPRIDIGGSFIVGDSLVDMQLAIVTGMRGYWVHGVPLESLSHVTPLPHIQALKEYL